MQHTKNATTSQTYLGIGGPVRELLQALSNLVVLENVESTELCSLVLQQGYRCSAEAALGRVGGAFHEEHDGVGRYQAFQS